MISVICFWNRVVNQLRTSSLALGYERTDQLQRVMTTYEVLLSCNSPARAALNTSSCIPDTFLSSMADLSAESPFNLGASAR